MGKGQFYPRYGFDQQGLTEGPSKPNPSVIVTEARTLQIPAGFTEQLRVLREHIKLFKGDDNGFNEEGDYSFFSLPPGVETIANGCGSPGTLSHRAPDNPYGAACDMHDECYYYGYYTRNECDMLFHQDMLDIFNERMAELEQELGVAGTQLLRLYYSAMAEQYYRAVVHFGMGAWCDWGGHYYMERNCHFRMIP